MLAWPKMTMNDIRPSQDTCHVLACRVSAVWLCPYRSSGSCSEEFDVPHIALPILPRSITTSPTAFDSLSGHLPEVIAICCIRAPKDGACAAPPDGQRCMTGRRNRGFLATCPPALFGIHRPAGAEPAMAATRGLNPGSINQENAMRI